MSSILGLLFAFHCLAHAFNLGYEQTNGITRLLGTSFGLYGQNATFDYIIIGGGTAGNAIAKRLAENSSLSVAVIEAGGFYEQFHSNISQIPAFAGVTTGPDPSQQYPAIDWSIAIQHQPQLLGLAADATVQAGKTFGGGSARNYMTYQRGTAGSYQAWADNVGDSSFTFDNLLPYFKKSANFTPPNYAKRGPGTETLYNSSDFSTSGGPLHVSYTNYIPPITRAFQDAFEASNISQIAGLNGGKLIGWAEATLSIDPKSGTRSSSETSFLQQALSTTPLTVYSQTLAERIVFDGTTAKAVAVKAFGQQFTLSARQEIIISAGVFRSPQLLMVSGVGPKRTLDELDIPVVADLAGVGQGMWDQPLFQITYVANITTSSQLQTNKTYLTEAVDQFLTSQTGPLTTPAGSTLAFEKLPQAYYSRLSNSTRAALDKFPEDWPDVEYIVEAASLTLPLNTSDTNNYTSTFIVLLTPTSRGTVTINTTDTGVNPIVSPNWLLTPEDQEVAVAAFKRAREIGSKAPQGFFLAEVLPGPQVQSDEEILRYLKTTVVTVHHYSRTCMMGKAGDPGAVVDSKARVFGVKRLRIVDASVFNVLPPGHCQATVYCLAEKIAAEIQAGL